MKRIVSCADGTWNVRDQQDEKTKKRRPTNVTKVARAVLPRAANGVDQIVFYHDGVGTSGGLDKYTGGAFGDACSGYTIGFEPSDTSGGFRSIRVVVDAGNHDQLVARTRAGYYAGSSP